MLYQFSSEFTYDTTYVTQNFYVSKEHDPLIENEVNDERIEKSSKIIQRRFLWRFRKDFNIRRVKDNTRERRD